MPALPDDNRFRCASPAKLDRLEQRHLCVEKAPFSRWPRRSRSKCGVLLPQLQAAGRGAAGESFCIGLSGVESLQPNSARSSTN